MNPGIALPAGRGTAEEILRKELADLYRGRDVWFALLIAFQWLAAVLYTGLTPVLSGPHFGTSSNQHFLLAFLLGGAVSIPALALSTWCRGTDLSRYSIAIAQVFWSCLIVYLTNGRLGSHYHVFISLTVLSAYRDRKILMLATLIVLAEHLARTMAFSPLAYGAGPGILSQFLEHAFWVVMLSAFLCLHVRNQVAQMGVQAKHQADLEALNQAFEARVDERTEQLSQSIQTLSEVLEGCPAGIIMLDEAFRVRLWNPEAARMFQLRREDVLGRELPAVLPELGAAAQGALARLLLGESASNIEHQIDGPPGKSGLVVMQWSLISGPEERGGSLLGIVVDVTERQSLQHQLAHAQKLEAIGQLAAGIAHEINTPMQYVGDNMRFLKSAFEDLDVLLREHERLCEKAAGVPALSKVVERVLKQESASDPGYLREEIPQAISQSLEGVERVSRIVRAMKEFSHPGSQEMQPADLNHLVENAITVARNEWKYVAELECHWDAELGAVPCLAGELNQVVLNLIVNASHAIAEAIRESPGTLGRIIVSTRSEGMWAEIRVQDSGTGIPEKIQPRVFDPFFTTKEVGRGTGQGLSLCHHVVTRLHSGEIHFETAEGRGTTFVVRIPLVQATDEAAA